MSALEYVFGCLRQEALAAASMIITPTSRLGLVSLNVESTHCSEWGSRHNETTRIVNSKLSFGFSRSIWLRLSVVTAISEVLAATSWLGLESPSC